MELRIGSISRLKMVQVFVVLFLVCGGWLGLMVGVLRRWRSSESLDEFWEKAVSWGRGNCERIRLGLQLELQVVFG